MEIYNIESVLFLMQGLIGVRECKMIDDYKLSTWKKKKASVPDRSGHDFSTD